MRALSAVATTLALTAAVAAAAPIPAPLPVEAYGALLSVDLVSVSPDGSRLALVVGDDVTPDPDPSPRRQQPPAGARHRPRQSPRTPLGGENHLLVTASQTAKLGG